MPSTVHALLRGAGLDWARAVGWGDRPPLDAPGVYLVALTGDPAGLPPPTRDAPLSPAALDELLARGTVTVDGQPADRTLLAERVAAYWLPDEPVVYIGETSRPVSERVIEYYGTPLGARSPHHGGWWVKLLPVPLLWVHFAPTDAPKQAKGDLIQRFCDGVSPTTRSALREPDLPLPFADLEWWPSPHKRLRKRHGIGGVNRPGIHGDSIAWEGRWSHGRQQQNPRIPEAVPTRTA